MTKDFGKHQEIRRNIMRSLGGKAEFFSSHDDNGNIKFFVKMDEGRIDLAEPDILNPLR